MMLTHARKMRVYPSEKQKRSADTTLGHCRYVYNKMLERNTKVYRRRGEHLSYYDMQNLLPTMKKYLPWLKDADSQALKYACRQLDTAFQKFFKKQASYPKVHSRKRRQAYTTTAAANIKVEPGRVKLPCLGWVRTGDQRAWDSSFRICYATVSREPDGSYYISITYKVETADPPVCGCEKVIGLDYKSDGLYVDSDGHIADMPHFYRKAQKERTKLSRQLSKKIGSRKGEKPSNNFKKLQKRLAKKSRHVANQRKDFLHKLSTEIANQYDVVCVEDLDMKAIANRKFGNGKATLDNGYGMFLTMLAYKLEERGKHLVKVDRWYPSSQLCQCGYQNPITKDLSVRTITCPKCGRTYDRDANAAVNIRNEGLRLLKQPAA